MQHVIYNTENCFTGNFAVRDPGVRSDHKNIRQISEESNQKYRIWRSSSAPISHQ